MIPGFNEWMMTDFMQNALKQVYQGYVFGIRKKSQNRTFYGYEKIGMDHYTKDLGKATSHAATALFHSGHGKIGIDDKPDLIDGTEPSNLPHDILAACRIINAIGNRVNMEYNFDPRRLIPDIQE